MTPRCGRLGWWMWGVLAALGLVGVWQRLSQGHLLANYGSYVPWGLWVAAYIYFVGLSAGAFLLSSLVYVFKVKALEPIGRLSLVIAVITLFMALLSIWFDIGHMERFWYVFVRPNFRSMMAWMIWMYTAYFLLLSVELVLVFRQPTPERKRWLMILGSLGVPLAIAFHGGVGALFAVVGARPYWHSSLFPILFLSGALTSGGALLLSVVAWRWPACAAPACAEFGTADRPGAAGRGDQRPLVGLPGFIGGPSASAAARAYAEAGFELDPAAHELPDHISIELEFMGRLLERGDMDDAKTFFQEHLNRWAFRCLEDVKRNIPAGFYRIAADTLTTFLQHEQQFLR